MIPSAVDLRCVVFAPASVYSGPLPPGAEQIFTVIHRNDVVPSLSVAQLYNDHCLLQKIAQLQCSTKSALALLANREYCPGDKALLAVGCCCIHPMGVHACANA